MPPRGRAAGRPGRPGSHGPRSSSAPPPPSVSGGPTSGDVAAHRARLHAIIEPVAVAAGCDLEELAVVRMGRRYVVRVMIDRDGGVGVDAVAQVARQVSHALDDAEAAGGEFIAGEYQLEVSSPGVDRPLTTPRHWRRNAGRLVRVVADGDKIFGRVGAVDDDGVTFDVDGKTRVVAFADLGPGRVEVEFSRLDEVDEDDMVAFVDDDDADHDDADHDDADHDSDDHNGDGDHADDEDDEDDEEDAP